MTEASDPSATPDFLSADLLLSAIVGSSDDAIVSKNLNGIVTSWNPAAERIFGYSAAEMIGRPITAIIPPERLNEEPQILDRLRRGERVDHFYTRRVRKDGTYVDVSLTISPIRNKEGVIVGASKIARDVTERKRTEDILRTQKVKMEILNQVGTSLAAERDLQTLVQIVTDAGRELSNAAFGAFFYNTLREDGEAYMLYTLSGAPREAFEKFGMPRNTPLFGPTFAGTETVRVADVLQDPRYGKMAPHHGMPKGHLPVRSYLAVPVISRSGAVLGGLFFGHPEPGIFTEEAEAMIKTLCAEAAVAIDNARLYEKLERELEQQRRMEKALRESEELSSSVLNSTADCIKVLDLEGHLLSMNPPGLALFDIDNFEELRGRSWIKLWPQEMHGTIQGAMAEARKGGVGRFEGLCITAKGAPKWWDVIISPLRDSEGHVVRLTATSRDVTEQRKAVEEARAAGAEAERQSRMKDEFLATLSHELRTPLQSILGWIQLLRSEPCDPEEINEGLEVIDRNARAQTRIIEDLLDMSRILSGKVRLDVQRLELAPVIQAALQTVEPAAQAKEIRLQAILDPLAQPVSGDPSRLQQIFWNLLSNAIKFTPRGGRVQILLERVNSHLEVSVTDTGVGISPEFLPYVFERFRQADASSTRRHSGLGLGLAIAKHLAELHGGSIRAKSGGPSQGSTFTVILPLAVLHFSPEDRDRRHPAHQGEPALLGDLPDLKGISVMVVDDEEDARKLVALVLSKAGAIVRAAASAAEAREILAANVPDVLISDIGMPDEDGHSLMRSIRALPPDRGGKVPAIALSAYTRTEDRIRAISAGFQMHLPKPADTLELLTMVESLAGKA
ncbi:MAG TPA: PAS domain S-box protein [Prosthecobacter sp.]|nr:PAS domain S-box protein [Prosthecobacter sp.]